MNLASLAEKNLEERGVYERLFFEGRSYTNLEIHEQSCRLATSLGKLGLVPGDKVVVMMPNAPEVFVSYAGIWRAGLTAIPVLFMLETSELSYILQNSKAKAIIVSPEILYKVTEARGSAPTLAHVAVTGSNAPEGALSFDSLVAAGIPAASIVERADSDLAVVLYTSGTTGTPKGVMQTHQNLLANATNGFRSATRPMDQEVTLLVLPLAHSFGLSVAVGGHLFGGKGVLMKWFHPEECLKLIQEHKVTGMAGVPTMFVYMMMHPNAGAYDTSTVTRWLVGAAPMPWEQIQEFERKFGGAMYMGYGLTESCPGIAVQREGEPRKAGSTGRAMEGVSVKVVDDEGKEVPRGEKGEICAAGENISPGYYEMPEATAETFKGGWLYTGDVGYLDEDGHLFIVERKKDLVIRGGLNVYPKDVEEVLYGHPSVQECAVVGVPSKLMGEEVCAFVVKRPGAEATESELMAHAQGKLAKYKTPRWIEFLSSMPKTNIGKIQKKELRKIAAEKHES